MTNPHPRRSNSIRHSKDDALTDREFELLLEGAGHLDEPYASEAQFTVLVLGRLGLRRGELTHMRETWLNWREDMIEIPLQQDCTKAKDAAAVCGYCKQLAQQRAEYNDDISMDQALRAQWRAKTPAASRDVYFGFDARLGMHISRFFDDHDRWELSSTAVNRRVKSAAERAAELDPADVRPHGLRATAATAMAAKGLEMHSLMQHFGWVNPSTAKVYLSRNSQNTARQLDSIHQG